ncbi:3-keto-disaccharide hydrolase [Microlunatus antarcticus]|uniref:3-keto-alpha-glucoside-1,2-lyase/3-keto-2-hydroxy-glucal hydratase domain-containing protein n=1 Tax=Microlunatus antarcticus TaxID=53388 RepID=A0A7W5JU79_9ACTN|nr:DUF1080 domain-containing protein [Microlunatus antarcticus]MBB3326427.1 hypothetical protein [Microlunatus antarcticus]
MTSPTRGEPVSLFNGRTLDGWHAVPRVYGTVWPGGPPLAEVYPVFTAEQAALAEAYPARWEVVDGAIEGFQHPDHPGFGGYLVSDDVYADFELTLEMNPDWPADTGVMVRRRADSWHGFQVLVDHRKSGSIGGFYGNGLAGFHGVPYVLDVSQGPDGAPSGLQLEDPATTLEPMTADKQTVLAQTGDPQAFLEAWRWQGWNALRIRCVGAQPVITTWVNDVLVASIDTATIRHPHYDAGQVADFLGPAGHLAFEVHDNDPFFGDARWARGARCRWRNIVLTPL